MLTRYNISVKITITSPSQRDFFAFLDVSDHLEALLKKGKKYGFWPAFFYTFPYLFDLVASETRGYKYLVNWTF